jgi:hypothetical protein
MLTFIIIILAVLIIGGGLGTVMRARDTKELQNRR